jgi:hypothetical protein
MEIRSLTGQQLVMAWLGGLTVTAAIVAAGRFGVKRAFDGVMREVETAGFAHGFSSANAPTASAVDVQSIRSFHLPADSPDAFRIARATRRLKLVEGLFLSVVLAVALALVALTAYWIWLRAR